jgi:Tol biopolymer transport system component
MRWTWWVLCLLSVVVALESADAAAARSSNGQIAFSTGFVLPYEDRDIGSQIFVVNPVGTGLQQLTHVAGGHDAASPAWSPDGRRIVYQSDPAGEYDLWVMNGDGSGQHRLLRDPGWDDEQPSWSPDGRRIVFARCGPFFECDIAVVNADGSGLRHVVGGHRVNEFPSFSPDGRWIVFNSDRGGFQSAVWKVRTNGRGLVRLTVPALEAFTPDWSPDGRRILFTNACCLPFSEVYVMRPDGSGVRRITHSATGHQSGFARFSPDGRRIVFMSDRAYPDACCNELYMARVDGSDVRRVTHTGFAGELADWGRTP